MDLGYYYSAFCRCLQDGCTALSRMPKQIVLMMKIMTFLLFIACMQVSAAGYSQISLSGKDVPLQKVFKEIQRQSGYDFLYNPDLLQSAGTINIHVRNVSLQQALDACLKGKSLSYSIMERTVVVKPKIILPLVSVNGLSEDSPPINVKGIVVNEKGEPVAATIKVKGTKFQTASDVNGFFELIGVDDKAVLVITGVNIETYEISISGRTEMTINVKTRVTVGEEVVVEVNTGYQRIPKERATGSFTTINKKEFNQQAGSTVLDRLEHISNGLYFDRQTGGGTSPKLVIRGLSTIQGPRAPLIILDDFPFEGNLDNINPNEIESITILKDAAAASIWGTRAGNGVIVITTKKGRYEQAVKIELSSNILFTQEPNLEYVKDISSLSYIEVEKFLYGKGFYTSQLTTQPWLGVSPVIETLRKRDAGLISGAAADSQIAVIGSYSLRDQMRKYVYNTGVNLQQAFTVRGGSKNIAWNISGGWDRNINVLNAAYNRYNLRSGQSFKLAKQLELTTGIDFTQSNDKAGRAGYGTLAPLQGKLPVYTQLADGAGNGLPVTYRFRDSYTDTAGAGKLLDWKWYPLSDHLHNPKETRMQAILASIGLSYQLKNGLGATLKYQYGNQVSLDNTINSLESYFTRNLVNSFSSINRSTGQVVSRIPMGGVVSDQTNTTRTQNLRLQSNYNKRMGAHAVDAIAGSEYRAIDGAFSSSRSYGFNPETYTTVGVDGVTRYPNFLTGSLASVPSAGGSYAAKHTRYVSFYANVAYSFKEKYTFSASARRDASNLFGATTNNRWTPLWSVGGSWNIYKESFFSLKAFEQLQLHASYGRSGNADPLRSAVTVLTYLGASTYTQLPIATIWQYQNPGLKWEQVGTFNIGLNFIGKNNRLSGSVEFYHKKASNLFGNTLVDYTAVPVQTLAKNVATIAGKGWDIQLNSRNITGPLSWSSQLILNFNRDKVLNYYRTSEQGNSYTSGTSVSAIEGRPVYALYGFRWGGLDAQTGEPIGYLNGQPSKNYASITGAGTTIGDLVYHGPTLPRLVTSLSNTIAWKKLSLTIRITGKFGHYFQRSSVDYTALFNNRVGHTDYDLRWQSPGDEVRTYVPSMMYPLSTAKNNFYRASEILASKADFVRLQFISLGYDLGKPSLQLYCSANNLGLLWTANSYSIDPEYNNTLPSPTTIAFGIRATF